MVIPPSIIGKLAGCLEFLGLSGCSGISKLPASIGDLKCLMHLNMSYCTRIKELPDSLGDLTNLLHFDLSSCSRLKVIPESLCGLTQLQYLNLDSCSNIGWLPKAIGCLVDLQCLNMSHCGVRELPESFKRLGNLLYLGLVGSCVEKGLSGALRGLTALQHLDMSRSYTPVEYLEKDDLPDAMRNLTSLKVLNFKCLRRYFDVENNGGYLDFIGTLTNLECLDLSYNYNTPGYLPESLSNLKRLLTLHLQWWFGFMSLPESIGDLKRLHTLNLKNCSIHSLPESIGGASGLKSLLLDGCSHKVMDQASSLLHYSLTLPLFKVRADDVSGHSNLHLLQGENSIDELRIVCLENVRFVEEARRLELSTKKNIRNLTLSWTEDADRFVEDKDLFGDLVPSMSLESFCLEYYSSQSFPNWFMDTSHHFPNITHITLVGLPKCISLPPLGQLSCLEILVIRSAPGITKIDSSICGGNGAFPRLKEVSVQHMDNLQEWNTTYPGKDGVEFMFPMLQHFVLSRCPRLRLKPACPPKCQLCQIEDCDQVISSLEELEISNHYLSNSTLTISLHISAWCHSTFRIFHHFPALQELVFFWCLNLTGLPEAIKQLSSLQELKLNYCGMSALPEWLSDISSLKKLHIIECPSLKSLPQCIQQLTNLQKLVIGWNQELQQWCESEENKAKLAHIKHIIYDNVE